MIGIHRFNKDKWGELKSSIMEVENICFPAELRMTEEETQDCMCADGAIVYLAYVDGKIVGNTYGNILSTVDKGWFDGHWNPKTYRNYSQKTLYITSTAILPKYRNQGIATKLKKEMFDELVNEGFCFVVGHAHKGTMMDIVQKFGGIVLKKFPRWYGSRQTHYLYEVDLNNLVKRAEIPHYTQQCDYTCGLASLAIIVKDEIVNKKHNSHYCSPISGISHEDLMQASYELSGNVLRTKYSATIQDIHDAIDEGFPVIVNYQDGKDGHYSVVCGYNKDNIFIFDVFDGKEKKFANSVFLKVWFSKIYGYRWMAY
jgi:GNAT superfamily N-acetyltransferase